MISAYFGHVIQNGTGFSASTLTQISALAIKFFPLFSLSEDDLVVINVGEDDSVMISLFPVVNSNSIDPQCITTYEERTFDFELPFCDHESRVKCWFFV